MAVVTTFDLSSLKFFDPIKWDDWSIGTFAEPDDAADAMAERIESKVKALDTERVWHLERAKGHASAAETCSSERTRLVKALEALGGKDPILAGKQES